MAMPRWPSAAAQSTAIEISSGRIGRMRKREDHRRSEIMSRLRLPVPDCQMFATLAAKISGDTIAPHENPD
jgi:hypothetical protein